MARRCIMCWNKVSNDSILIADDFDGCFCQRCYQQSSEKIDTLLSLMGSFFDAQTDAEASEQFETIEKEISNVDLHEEGEDLLITYLSGKVAEVQNDEQFEQSQERRREYEQHKHLLRNNFIAVTSNSIEGYRITAYHGIVTGTSVLGTGFFSEHNAMWADFWGKESRSFSQKMERAKDSALEYAIENAVLAGGNAMIAVDIDYSMFGSNMIAAVINGTAVTIEKV